MFTVNYLFYRWPVRAIDLYWGFICIVLTTSVAGCSTCRDQHRMEQDSKRMANLFCEAKTLRIQRFELADQIRFAQDALPELRDQKRQLIRLRLDSLIALVDPLALKTKIMAERIDSIQQGYYKGRYRDNQKKKELDLAFQKAIEELCPD